MNNRACSILRIRDDVCEMLSLKNGQMFGAVTCNDDSPTWLFCEVEEIDDDGIIHAMVINGSWPISFNEYGISKKSTNKNLDIPEGAIKIIFTDNIPYSYSDYNNAIEYMKSEYDKRISSVNNKDNPK